MRFLGVVVTAFRVASSLAWLAIIAFAAIRRGRLFAGFAFFVVGIHTVVSCAVVPHAGPLFPAFAYLQAATYAHFFMLSTPKLRPLVYRLIVSVPASYFVASTFLAFPWAIAAAFGLPPWGVWIPYVLGVLGLIQSLTARREVLDLHLDRAAVEGLQRYRVRPPEKPSSRPLRLVQITDTHLGPFMSVDRLRSICQRAVDHEPDLVLLTGDFLTMESQETAAHLAEALSPLATLQGKVFACHGNHDHEAPELVASALSKIGARLLIDEHAMVETEAGPVQVVGMDYHFRDRQKKIADCCARSPRVDGALRLVLLHDPGAFRHLPEGEGDLVLSGHTHGGQLGLLSLGVRSTIIRLFVDMPDHGLWARGRDRLYVHRGTGHYGFPLRIGVPAEESLLRVHY